MCSFTLLDIFYCTLFALGKFKQRWSNDKLMGVNFCVVPSLT